MLLFTFAHAHPKLIKLHPLKFYKNLKKKNNFTGGTQTKQEDTGRAWAQWAIPPAYLANIKNIRQGWPLY